MANQYSYLSTEVVIIAMVRALRDLPGESLHKDGRRLNAYAAADIQLDPPRDLAELLAFDWIALEREQIRRRLFPQACATEAAAA